MFTKATKKKLKARIAFNGPAGGGKTFSALRCAFALGKKVAVIDTEHKSAAKYAGEAPDGLPFEFDVCELEHFSPQTYANVINAAGQAGYDVLIVDSLSHAWEGKGGALDTVDRKASTTKGGSFSAWRDVTPMHRAMIEAMLSSPCHVIVTMRTKTAYEVKEQEQDGRKKMTVEKIGTKPIQREGMEYEFDVVADLDLQHIVTISKSRCPRLDGAKEDRPGALFWAPLVEWLNTGETVEASPAPVTLDVPSEPDQGHEMQVDEPCGTEMADKIKTTAMEAELPPEKIREILTRHGVQRLAELPWNAANELLHKLELRIADATVPF